LVLQHHYTDVDLWQQPNAPAYPDLEQIILNVFQMRRIWVKQKIPMNRVFNSDRACAKKLYKEFLIFLGLKPISRIHALLKSRAKISKPRFFSEELKTRLELYRVLIGLSIHEVFTSWNEVHSQVYLRATSLEENYDDYFKQRLLERCVHPYGEWEEFPNMELLEDVIPNELVAPEMGLVFKEGPKNDFIWSDKTVSVNENLLTHYCHSLSNKIDKNLNTLKKRAQKKFEYYKPNIKTGTSSLYYDEEKQCYVHGSTLDSFKKRDKNFVYKEVIIPISAWNYRYTYVSNWHAYETMSKLDTALTLICDIFKGNMYGKQIDILKIAQRFTRLNLMFDFKKCGLTAPRKTLRELLKVIDNKQIFDFKLIESLNELEKGTLIKLNGDYEKIPERGFGLGFLNSYPTLMLLLLAYHNDMEVTAFNDDSIFSYKIEKKTRRNFWIRALF
jgi:hypothetical protein